jgi:hypothetical protein
LAALLTDRVDEQPELFRHELNPDARVADPVARWTDADGSSAAFSSIFGEAKVSIRRE